MNGSQRSQRLRFTRPGAVLFIAAALGGCVAVWGGSYKVESANADAVTMKYDGHFISRRNVMKIAQGKCAGFDRRAELRSISTSIWGLTTMAVGCVPLQGTPPMAGTASAP
jgi:hypothetical protein